MAPDIPSLKGQCDSFQVLIDAGYHNHYLTRLHHNGECRMPLHAEPPIRCEGVVAKNARLDKIAHEATREVPGQSLVTQLMCRDCGRPHPVLELKVTFDRRTSRLKRARACLECGGDVVATGFGSREEVNPAALPPHLADRTLRAIGVREGDVLGIRDSSGCRRYVEVDSRGGKAPGRER